MCKPESTSGDKHISWLPDFLARVCFAGDEVEDSGISDDQLILECLTGAARALSKPEICELTGIGDRKYLHGILLKLQKTNRVKVFNGRDDRGGLTSLYGLSADPTNLAKEESSKSGLLPKTANPVNDHVERNPAEDSRGRRSESVLVDENVPADIKPFREPINVDLCIEEHFQGLPFTRYSLRGPELETTDGQTLQNCSFPFKVLVTGISARERRLTLEKCLKEFWKRLGNNCRILVLSVNDSCLDSIHRQIQSEGSNSEASCIKLSTQNLSLVRDGIGSLILCTIARMRSLRKSIDEDEFARFLRLFSGVVICDLHLGRSADLNLAYDVCAFYSAHVSGSSQVVLVDDILEPSQLKEFLFKDQESQTIRQRESTVGELFVHAGVWGRSALKNLAQKLIPELIRNGYRPLVTVPEQWMVTPVRRAIEEGFKESSAPVLGLAAITDESWKELVNLAQNKYTACVVPSRLDLEIEWPCNLQVLLGLPDRPAFASWALQQRLARQVVFVPDLSRPADMYYARNPDDLCGLLPALLIEHEQKQDAGFRLALPNGGYTVSPGDAARKYFAGAVFYRGERLRVTTFDDSSRRIIAERTSQYDFKTRPFENVDVEVLEIVREKETTLGTLCFGRIQIHSRVSMYQEFRTKEEVICERQNCLVESPSGRRCTSCGGSLKWSSYDYSTKNRPTGPIDVVFDDFAIWLCPLASVPAGDRWEFAHTLEHTLRFAAHICLGVSLRNLAGYASDDGVSFVWDTINSQAGLCAWLFDHFAKIEVKLKETLDACSCSADDGCESCIQAPYCESGGVGLSKVLLYECLPTSREPEVVSLEDANVDYEKASEFLEGTDALFGGEPDPDDDSQVDVNLSATGVDEEAAIPELEELFERREDAEDLQPFDLSKEEETTGASVESEQDVANTDESYANSRPWFEFTLGEQERDNELEAREPISPFVTDSVTPDITPFVSETFGKLDDSEKALQRLKRRFPVLEKPIQMRLLQQAQAGDLNARDRLVVHNLGLVFKHAFRQTVPSKNSEFVDLVQEGSIGLLKAVERFDFSIGGAFSTYADWWIRQRISRFKVNYCRTIRLPVHMHETLSKYVKAIERLKLELGRRPSDRELAIEMHTNEESVRNCRLVTKRFNLLSTDLPLRPGEEEIFIADLLAADESCQPEVIGEKSEVSEFIETMLLSLPQRLGEILRMRFGLKNGEFMTLEQIGQHFHLTRERIRQLEARAIKQLQRTFQNERKSPFFEEVQLPPQMPTEIYVVPRNDDGYMVVDRQGLGDYLLKKADELEQQSKTYRGGFRVGYYQAPVSVSVEEEVLLAITNGEVKSADAPLKNKLYYLVLDFLRKNGGYCTKELVVANIENRVSSDGLESDEDSELKRDDFIFWVLNNLLSRRMLRDAFGGQELALTESGLYWLKCNNGLVEQKGS